MFSQVAQAHTTDPAAAQRALKRWATIPGVVNVTAGITEDGRLIAVITYESEESAHSATHDRQALLNGRVSVRDGTRTDLFTPGDLTRSSFVQVVQGQVTDIVEARRHRDLLEEALAEHLPCLLGTLTVEHDGQRFTRVLYFSTEEEARAVERDTPAEVRHIDEGALRLLTGPVEFTDLRDPWVLVPQRPGWAPREAVEDLEG